MDDYVTPRKGQVWKHRHLGREMEVLSSDGENVRILAVQGRERSIPVGMHATQLNSHYEYVRDVPVTQDSKPECGGCRQPPCAKGHKSAASPLKGHKGGELLPPGVNPFPLEVGPLSAEEGV